MINLSGCSSDISDIHEKIHSKFYTMPSYKAECTLTVNSNKTVNNYDFVCTYDSTGNRYRIDYPDVSVILTPTDARIIKGDSVINIPSEAGHMLMFVNTFFESYYAGEKTAISANASDSGYTLLEAELISPTTAGHHMKLWIDNKSILPYNMKVYDKNNRESLNVKFKSFETIKSEK